MTLPLRTLQLTDADYYEILRNFMLLRFWTCHWGGYHSIIYSEIMLLPLRTLQLPDADYYKILRSYYDYSDYTRWGRTLWLRLDRYTRVAGILGQKHCVCREHMCPDVSGTPPHLIPILYFSEALEYGLN